MAVATFSLSQSFLRSSISNPGRRLPNLTSVAFRGCTSSSCLPASCIELAQTRILIHGKEFSIIQPKDVDQVLDMYIEQGRLDGDPYWCRIWPSAIVLAEEILKNPQLVAKLHVCDLGCGLGLAGLAAVVAGARQVVFYDQEPLALLCSLLTVHTNIPHVATNIHLVMQHICADIPVDYDKIPNLPLWKSASSLCSVLFHTSGRHQIEDLTLTAKAEVFNWSKKNLQAHKFDMVLACDVLYEKASVPIIAELLPKLLLHSGNGKVLMTDPTHRTPQNRSQLLNILNNRTGNESLKLEKTESRERKTEEAHDDVELLHFICH